MIEPAIIGPEISPCAGCSACTGCILCKGTFFQWAGAVGFIGFIKGF